MFVSMFQVRKNLKMKNDFLNISDFQSSNFLIFDEKMHSSHWRSPPQIGKSHPRGRSNLEGTAPRGGCRGGRKMNLTVIFLNFFFPKHGFAFGKLFFYYVEKSGFTCAHVTASTSFKKLNTF